MIDPITLVRTWLLIIGSPVPAALAGERVWGVTLPEWDDLNETGFRPEDGPGVVLTVQGGNAHTEILPIQKFQIGVRVWAGENQSAIARRAYIVIFGWLHGKNNLDFGAVGSVISSVEATAGQDIIDPDSGWATVFGQYEILVRDPSA